MFRYAFTRNSPAGVMVLCLLVTGCPTSPSTPDVRDQWIVLTETGPDTRGAVDAGPDYPPLQDLPVTDTLSTDAPLSAATVLYAVPTGAKTFGLRTASTDGTGAPAPVAGWSGKVEFDHLQLAGLQEYVPVSRGRPQITSDQESPFHGVELPGSAGTVYYFHRQLLGTSGLLLVKPDGNLEILMEVQGLYQTTLSSHLAFTASGKTGAAVHDANKLVLFRTDGTTFSGGKSWTSPGAGTLSITTISDASMTIAGTWIYVAALVGSNWKLLRAPLNGTGALSEVTLPKSGGKSPAHIDSHIAISEDGKTLVLLAGVDSTSRDLYVVQVQSGAAVNITKDPGVIARRGSHLGNLSAHLAVSPGGAMVAYLKQVNGTPELFVTAVSSGKTAQVSSDARFQISVTSFANLVFADDSSLLWMAGISDYSLDLYRWDHAQGKITNLTARGSTTAPFDGYGDFVPRAAWWSPSGQWFYWIEYRYQQGISDLRGINRKTGKLVSVTQNAEVPGSPGTLAACGAGGKVYFAAEQVPSQNNREIWVFDQTQGTSATRLTTTSNSPTAFWYVFNIHLTGDCKHLAWTAGGSYSLRLLWRLETSKPTVTKKVTFTPRFVSRALAYTPDHKTIVYGSGGSTSGATLKATPIPGGTSATIDPTPGSVYLLAVY